VKLDAAQTFAPRRQATYRFPLIGVDRFRRERFGRFGAVPDFPASACVATSRKVRTSRVRTDVLFQISRRRRPNFTQETLRAIGDIAMPSATRTALLNGNARRILKLG
jgi:hypothetical protein